LFLEGWDSLCMGGAGVVLEEPWTTTGSVVIKPGLTFNEMNELHGQLQQTRWASRFGDDVPKQVCVLRLRPLSYPHTNPHSQRARRERDTHNIAMCCTERTVQYHVGVSYRIACACATVRLLTSVATLRLCIQLTVHTSRFRVGCCSCRDSSRGIRDHSEARSC
jgi:hypothetical protein